MHKITISGLSSILLIYLSIFIVQNYGVNANILGKTIEKVCNIQEAICPPNKCCSNKICKDVKSSYKCCEIPIGYSRQTFSDYIISKEGWGCSNCPKCDIEIESLLNTDVNNESGKVADSSQNSYEKTGKAWFIFGFIFLILGLAVLVLLNRIY